MIYVIIAAVIIVILMCREAVLHKGSFFENSVEKALEGAKDLPLDSDFGDNPFWDKDVVGIDPGVWGTLPGDPGYSVYHNLDRE